MKPSLEWRCWNESQDIPLHARSRTQEILHKWHSNGHTWVFSIILNMFFSIAVGVSVLSKGMKSDWKIFYSSNYGQGYLVNGSRIAHTIENWFMPTPIFPLAESSTLLVTSHHHPWLMLARFHHYSAHTMGRSSQ